MPLIESISNTLSNSPIVEGGLTLMVAGWLGYQARRIPQLIIGRARSFMTRRIEIRESNPLYDHWLDMVTNGAIRRGGPRTLQVRAQVRGVGSERMIDNDFAAGLDSFWARIHGKWCHVEISREPDEREPRSMDRRFLIEIEVFLATRRNLARMLEEAQHRGTRREDRQIVEVCDKWGSSHRLRIPRRDADTLCLPDGLFASLRDRIETFRASRLEYERTGIPWRFGVLLTGPPGTGKTSLAHVLASQFELPLAVLPLADMKSDEDLVSTFQAANDDAIILIEDVDCAFSGRESDDADGITFSGLLNCIDGMMAPHNGRVLIMSTNHVDRLDPALIRPGRVDLQLEVPALERAAAMDYVDRIFPHVPQRHDIVHEVMRRESPTAAKLINRLMREEWRRPGWRERRVSSGSPTTAEHDVIASASVDDVSLGL